MDCCNICDEYDKCNLKDNGFFDICPKYQTQVSQISKNYEIDYKILNRYFGYPDFRPLQKEIITDVLKGKDVLVLMPTGGGKSLCYQYPSLIFEGITIVVSPLIALMKNQVDNLKSYGIDAAYINSSLNYSEIKDIKIKLSENRIKLLYIAPERLTMPSFLEYLKGLKISLFAIDEAHCISEWGHDFRPEYRQLSLIKTNFSNIPIIGLTATATLKVSEDIINQLALKDTKKYIASFNRKNLFYSVKPKNETFEKIIEYLKKQKNDSGIIYCSSRSTVDSLTQKLKDKDYKVLPYHAGLSLRERAEAQERFMKDDINILVATIAFGMGIDKPNIRFVIHYDMPKNIESYYQETGRAGRDGLKSECILFYSYGDRQKVEYFINQMSNLKERQIALNKLKNMINFCDTNVCRRKILLDYFGEESKEQNCKSCDNCLMPKDKIDVFDDANKIFSCIKELDEGFGAGYVIDVLTGSKNQRILKNKHNVLSSYESGKGNSKKTWHSYIRELVQLGYLSIEGEVYPILKLGKKSKESSIFLTKQETIDVKKSIKIEHNTDSLFEVLRIMRKTLADVENIPPYMVFNDASLKQMSEKCPCTLEEFRKIIGVGERKLEKYGRLFTSEIKRYLDKTKGEKYEQ